MDSTTSLEQQVQELKMASYKNASKEFDEFIGKSIAGIVVDVEDGTIWRANPAANALFGYDEGGLFFKNIKDLMPERFRGLHDKHLKHFRENSKPRQMGESQMTLLGIKKDGTEFNIEISLFPGEVVGKKVVAAIIMAARSNKNPHGL